MNRRTFLKATGTLAATPWLFRGQAANPIRHVVVVTMENRSFDHLFGWLPNADGKQAGLSYRDQQGVLQATHPLAPDFTGCGHPDPDHSYLGARIEYDGGQMDGFLQGANDPFAIGYYAEVDLPFGAALARNYTACDRYFPAILGPTFPNRIFQYAAQTDRLDDTVALSTLPTIWDSLAAAGVSHKYYFSNLPFVALWGAKYLPITHLYAEFLIDCALGILPAVSFVDPAFTTIGNLANDDHPHSDVRNGDAFLAQVVRAVTHSPNWPHTVLIVNFDEWGGFFDHVPPPRATAPNNVDPDLVDGKALLGIRCPCIVVSPWSRGNPANPRVSHTVFDHTSVLKLIESVWGLPPLTARDASSDIGNLLEAMDFSNPQVSVPALPSTHFVVPSTLCSSTETITGILQSGLLKGFPGF